MENNTPNYITPEEREELALCGITSRKQLLQIAPTSLWRDIQQARECFPSRHFVLTRERLLSLYDTPISVATDEEKRPGESLQEQVPAECPNDELNIVRSAPEVRFQQRTRNRQEDSSASSTVKQAVPLHSSVRCTHPFKAVMAALCTLTLTIPLISLVALPWMMLTNNLPAIPLEVLAGAVLVFPCLAYIIFARLATCPVCHMRVFRFAHYTRNREAHYLPLLGYNFTTALHMLIFWRYNCPACGTPVKFYGVKGHRTFR